MKLWCLGCTWCNSALSDAHHTLHMMHWSCREWNSHSHERSNQSLHCAKSLCVIQMQYVQLRASPSCHVAALSAQTQQRREMSSIFYFYFHSTISHSRTTASSPFFGVFGHFIEKKSTRDGLCVVLCFRRLKIVCSRARTLLPSSLTIAYVRFNFDSFVTWADGAHRSSVYVRTVLRLLNSCALSHSHKI